MNKLSRRKFLTVAGASSAAAATGTVVTASSLLTQYARGDTLTLRAVAGVPAHPLPAHASYVIEGHVNLATRSGVLTRTLFAGEPNAMSSIAFPGMSRAIRITDVKDLGGTFSITGVIDDTSQLLPGESATINLLVDPSQHTARTNLFGTDLVLHLDR